MEAVDGPEEQPVRHGQAHQARSEVLRDREKLKSMFHIQDE